jgi:hypothetical protein
VIHPVDRERNGILALQKEIHVDVTPARAIASAPRENAPAEAFGTVDL